MAEGLSKLKPGNMPSRQDMMTKMREPAENKPMGEEHGAPMEVHDHGDGTFHTIKDGMKEEHPDLLHMTTHIAHAHEPESKHYHAKHDGFEGHTHGMHESGEHEETQSHSDPEEMGEGLKAFMGGGGGEHEGGDTEPEAAAPMGGM